MLTEEQLVKKFEKKLETLDNKQDTIEMISIWMLCYRDYIYIFSDMILEYARKHAANVLLSIYLINDVTQRASKYKWDDFRKAFEKIIDPILGLFINERSYKDIQSVEKTIRLWRERAVFSSVTIETIISKYGRGGLIKDLSPKKIVKYIHDLNKLCQTLSNCYQTLTNIVNSKPECLFDNESLSEHLDFAVVKKSLEKLLYHLNIHKESTLAFTEYYNHITQVTVTLHNWISSVN